MMMSPSDTGIVLAARSKLDQATPCSEFACTLFIEQSLIKEVPMASMGFFLLLVFGLTLSKNKHENCL